MKAGLFFLHKKGMKREKNEIMVAIQGIRGSYHDTAAGIYFKAYNMTVMACDTFRELFDAVTDGIADYGVAALENSVAGSLLPNYEHLRKSKLRVTGEICIPVKHNLLALPGQQLADIREIQSHSMAILQCSHFINKMRECGVRITESVDTALSARDICEGRLPGVAAIASERAAEIYGLSILERNIEDNAHNYTRFIIAGGIRGKQIHFRQPQVIKKAMICFSLPHEAGSLSRVLSVFASFRINLTMIQSLPLAGRPWEYLFYIDLVFTDINLYRRAMDIIDTIAVSLEVMGEFCCGVQPVPFLMDTVTRITNEHKKE